MKKINHLLFVLAAVFIFTSSAYSQDKVFLLSEDGYVSVVEYTDWNTDNSIDYSGIYEFVYPGFNEKEEYAGDVFQNKILISFDNGKLNVYTNLIVEGDWQENDTLENASISSNQLFPNDNKLVEKDTQIKFVLLKYSDAKGNVKTIYGIKVENSESENGKFYQKIK